jgi:hypothetical protein
MSMLGRLVPPILQGLAMSMLGGVIPPILQGLAMSMLGGWVLLILQGLAMAVGCVRVCSGEARRGEREEHPGEGEGCEILIHGRSFR